MKHFATIFTLTAIFCLSFALTACASDCTTQRGVVSATSSLPAYHTMVSGKTCNHSSRVVGTISSTCLYNEVGNLQFHRLVRSCECNSLPDVSQPGVAALIKGLQHVGEPCSREWDVAPGQYHPLFK